MVSMNAAESALLACPIGVVVQAIQQVAQLESGESLLVTGAGGGLGVHAVQLGASLGARVLAVTSSPEKVAALEELGASAVLEAGDAANGGTGVDFSELALAMTDDQGVDVVLDTVGSARFPSTWRCLSQYGRLVLLGEVTGRPVELNLAEVIFRDARLLGSSGVSRTMLQRAGELVGQGRLKPVVDRVLALEEAATAFELLSSRQVLGRLVLTAQ
jgi:NADPH:quinone reductase-like Zn-dependent oxidoreductase